MAKPFTLTPAQARQQKRDLDIKDKIVLQTQKAMNSVLKSGIEQVYDCYKSTGKFKRPNLDQMDKIGTDFYLSVVKAAIKSCQSHKIKKRLAKVPDGNLPDGESALDKILKNRGYFKRIMARKDTFIKKAKTAYIERLEKQFKKILPLLESTNLSPRDIKKKLSEAWDAGKARTETVFRTESTKYFAEAQVNYFKDNDEIIGFLYDSVRDTSRTSWCAARHGLIFTPDSPLLEANTPAVHWNCRSHLIPLANDPENQAMLKDPARKPIKSKLKFPPGWIIK